MAQTENLSLYNLFTTPDEFEALMSNPTRVELINELMRREHFSAPDRIKALVDSQPAEVMLEVVLNPYRTRKTRDLADGVREGFTHRRRRKPECMKGQLRDVGRYRDKCLDLIGIKNMTKIMKEKVRNPPWSAAEDARFRAAIGLLKADGKKCTDWKRHSREVFIGSRTPRECRIYFRDHIMREVKGPWTKEETEALVEVASRHPKGDWKKICKELNNGRPQDACRVKWNRIAKNVANRLGKQKGEITPAQLQALLITNQ